MHQDRHKHGTFEELSHDHCLLSKWKHVNRLPHYIHLCSVKTPLRTNFTSAYSQQAIECVPAYRLLTQLCLACVTYIRNDIDTQKLTWKLPLRRRLQTVIQYTFLMCQYPVCICLFNNVVYCVQWGRCIGQWAEPDIWHDVGHKSSWSHAARHSAVKDTGGDTEVFRHV